MTLEEAIKHCEEVAEENEMQFHACPMKYDGAYANNGKTACKCAEEHRQLAEWLKDYKRLQEQEPCEDAISRQAVKELFKEGNAIGIYYFLGIDNLPPVAPTPKTGHWIVTDDDYVYCSECEDSYYPRPIDASWYYCPHCGAKMESEG